MILNEFDFYQHRLSHNQSFSDSLESQLIVFDIPQGPQSAMIQRSVKEANQICFCLCSFHIAKLFFALSQYQNIIEPQFIILIMITSIYDVINIMHYLFIGILTHFIRPVDFLNYTRQFNVMALNTSITQIIIQELVTYYRSFNGLLVLDFIEQKSFYLNCIIMKFIYYAISLYTALIAILIDEPFPLIIKIYIILQISFWIVPLLMCFLWPFIMLWVVVLRQEINYQDNQNVIIKLFDQLTNKKFSQLKKEHPSIIQNDCPICYQEINESHSIIQLPCHKQHYFHADCCRQWLGTDQRCPLCRFGLEQPKEAVILEFI